MPFFNGTFWLSYISLCIESMFMCDRIYIHVIFYWSASIYYLVQVIMTVQHRRGDAGDTSLLNASFSSLSSLISLQLFSRLFTFILNQALFRIVSPKTFGTAAIQFELLLSTILFISREGVRNALLRARPSDEGRIARANLALLPSILGIPLAIIAAVGYSQIAEYETRIQPGFELSIGIYALAAVVELLSEPMHTR